MENGSQLMSMGKAAQRVHRSERTIQRWINEDGMRVIWKGGRKMVRLEDLLLHYRSNLKANPARQRLHPLEPNPMRGAVVVRAVRTESARTSI